MAESLDFLKSLILMLIFICIILSVFGIDLLQILLHFVNYSNLHSSYPTDVSSSLSHIPSSAQSPLTLIVPILFNFRLKTHLSTNHSHFRPHTTHRTTFREDCSTCFLLVFFVSCGKLAFCQFSAPVKYFSFI